MGRMKKHDQQTIAEEAAQWLAVLASPDGSKHERAFHQWLSRSSKHQDEYRLALRAYRRLDGLRKLAPSDAQAWLKGTSKRAAIKVVSFPISASVEPSLPPVRARHCGGILAGVISLMLVVVVGAGAFFWTARVTAAPVEHATAVGEQRTFRLHDGSEIVLNTNTRVRVTMTREARTIELIEGEFIIDVGRDHRPLSVISAGAVIRDIGTRFVVRRRHDTTDILVTEGIVDVTYRPTVEARARWSHGVSTRLTVGDAVLIGPDSVQRPPTVRALHTSEIEQRLSWREGVLRFSGETLEEIVSELNRYNIRQIQLLDPSLRTVRLGASLTPSNVDGLIDALRAIGYPVKAQIVTTAEGERIQLTMRETVPVRGDVTTREEQSRVAVGGREPPLYVYGPRGR